MRTAHIHINEHALIHNVCTIKQRLSNGTRLLAMVKANAYGHSIDKVVPSLTQADGFGVACMAEALAVKAHLSLTDTRPIVLIEGVFSQEEWHIAIAQRLSVVIHHHRQLEYALSALPAMDSPTATIWLKLNTGMNRLGFNAHKITDVAYALLKKGYRLILMSHFACADSQSPMNKTQIDGFATAFDTLKDRYGERIQGSLCNSAGIFRFNHCHYDWVRAGIALYGSSPFGAKPFCESLTHQALHLQAVMTLSARIMAVHTLAVAETVGYGALWRATRPSRIGIVSIGYGDGYPRIITDAMVWVGGMLVPIVGRVAMDMIAIDLTDCRADIGDGVILWGDIPSIDEVALSAGTISYELFCRLTTRPTR